MEKANTQEGGSKREGFGKNGRNIHDLSENRVQSGLGTDSVLSSPPVGFSSYCHSNRHSPGTGGRVT